MSESQIKIKAEPTAEICKFIVDREILPGRSVVCRSRETASGAPLFEALFAIEGVRELLVSGNVVTAAKSTSDPWPVLGKSIGAAIRSVLCSGQTPIPDDWGKKEPASDNGRLYKEVEEILASRVNPGVASHGGKVELVDVKGTSVYLRLTGGCQGCGAANVTLKQGIEKAIRARLPEVTEVIDVTNHASGKNPYYKTARSDGSAL